MHIASWRSAYRGILSDCFLHGPVEAERHVVWAERFSRLGDPDQIVVLAEEGGLCVGFACLLAGHDPRWGSLIDNLHVSPDRIGGGIGRSLLRDAVALIPLSYTDRPVHLTVLERNARAISAYQRWGGRLVERLTEREADDGLHAIRRYLWDSPADLTAKLAEATSR